MCTLPTVKIFVAYNLICPSIPPFLHLFQKNHLLNTSFLLARCYGSGRDIILEYSVRKFLRKAGTGCSEWCPKVHISQWSHPSPLPSFLQPAKRVQICLAVYFPLRPGRFEPGCEWGQMLGKLSLCLHCPSFPRPSLFQESQIHTLLLWSCGETTGADNYRFCASSQHFLGRKSERLPAEKGSASSLGL